MDFFGSLTTREFLSEYWQKKPLLVRGAVPRLEPPLTPAAFLELATHQEAQVRLILEEGGEYPWQLVEGPFEAQQLDPVPAAVWSMLIQEVDQQHAGVRALWKYLDFLPAWRLDDIMVSLASDRGGVGAHIDEYDVFLLQGHGQRRWLVSGEPVEDETLVDDLDVRILATFEPEHDWLVEPGDLVYLPPRYAHHGIAVGECMTYSLGCRAPSAADVLGGLLEDALMALPDGARYADPDLRPVTAPSALSPDMLAWAQKLVERVAREAERPLGRLLTEPRRQSEMEAEPVDMTPHALMQALGQGARLAAPGRYQSQYMVAAPVLVWFLRGEEIELDAALEPMVAAISSVHGARADDIPAGSDVRALLADLVSEGALIFLPG